MEPSEVRAEIERRKSRARDLKIRESIWSLYYWNFRSYVAESGRFSKEVLPDIRESFKHSNGTFEFNFGDTVYKLTVHDTAPETTTDPYTDDEEEVIRFTLCLSVNTHEVFEFEVIKTTVFLREAPLFHERMGEISCFIDGPWTVALRDLMTRVDVHNKAIQEQRLAPILEVQKRRFGL
jgi:hypothetical protein